MPRVSLALDYDGSLADSLRAVANLVEEYGDAFLADPASYYSIYNDGSVHGIEIECQSDDQQEVITAVAPAGWDRVEV